MAAFTDPDWVEWKIHRRWWPFDLSWIIDFDSITVTLVSAVPFVVLWPFWLASKFVGGKWRIVVERDNAEVRTELVRGWRRSGDRINAIGAEITHGQHPVAL